MDEKAWMVWGALGWWFASYLAFSFMTGTFNALSWSPATRVCLVVVLYVVWLGHLAKKMTQ